MRKNATKLAAAVLSLAMVMTSVSMPASAAKKKTTKINKSTATLYTNGSKSQKSTTLYVTVGGKKVKATFKSSNTKILTVAKKTGKVTAKKPGKATVTATYKKKNYKCTVTVKAYATSVKVSPTSVNLVKGKTKVIKATVSPSNASNKKVSFSSSNKAVATVSSTGKITAKKAGTAKITVTALGSKNDAKKAYVTVKVTNPAPAPTETPVVTETPAATETPVATVTPSAVATEGTITITTNVTGASVKVVSGTAVVATGSTATGSSFTTKKLDNGTYTVTVSKEGYKELSKVVTVKGDVTEDFALVKNTYEVKSVTSITNTLIDLELSEAADSAASTSEVVVKDATGKVVETKSVVLANTKKNFKVTTAAMTPGATYTVTVNGKTLSFVANVADTVAPELSEVKAKSNTKVELTFSEKLDKDSAENVANYAISNNLSVVKAELNSDQTKVTLTTSSQTANTVYKVTVSKVTDLAGNAVNTDKNNAEFGGIAADTAKPEVIAAATVTNTKVRVYFNEALDKASAETITNYAIDNKLSVLKAEYKEVDTDKDGDANDYYVELTTSSQTEATIYKVTVSNVKDVAGNVVETTKNNSLFAGLKVDTVKPNVAGASTVSNTKVDVLFNEEMDKASVENVANYSVDNGLSVLKAEQDKDNAKKVTLTTSSQTAGKIYKLTIANVKDLSGNVVETTKNTAEFGGVEADTQKPTIDSIMPASATELTVKFSESVDKTDAQYAANYYIQGLGYATKAELAADGKTVTLTTLSQELGKTYKLDVKNIKDLSGNVIDNVTKSFASGGYADTVAPKISSVIAKASNVIEVTFNEKVEETSAKASANYAINDGTNAAFAALVATDKLALLPDGKTVRIVLGTTHTSLTAGKILTIKTVENGVKDIAGNQIKEADITEKNFVVSSLTYGAPTIASVSATDTKTVVVKFNDYVDKATAEDEANYKLTKNAGETVTTDASKATLDKDGKTVTLTFNNGKFEAGKLYELTTSTVKEVVGEKGITTAIVKTFSGTGVENTAPEIATVNADDKQVITVKFNQALDVDASTDLEDKTKYFVDGKNPNAVKKVDEKTVKLYLTKANALETGKVYKIYIATGAVIKNVAGTNILSTQKEVTFAASSVDHVAPKIESAYVLDQDTVRIKFNQILASNLTETDLVISDGTNELSFADSNAVVDASIADTSLTAGTTYDLTIKDAKFVKGKLYSVRIADEKKVTDLTDIDSTARDKVEFGGIAPALISAVYKEVAGTDKDTLTLTFNTELSKDIVSTDNKATTIGKFIVKIGTIDTVTIKDASVDGNKIILTLADNETNGFLVWDATSKITINNDSVKDKAADANSNEEIKDFAITK